MSVYDLWKKNIGKRRYDAVLKRIRILTEEKQAPDKIAEVMLKELSRDIGSLFSIWTKTDP